MNEEKNIVLNIGAEKIPARLFKRKNQFIFRYVR